MVRASRTLLIVTARRMCGSNSLGVELLLTIEVPIEAALRETGDRHDLANRDPGDMKPLLLNRRAADLTILFRVCCL